jgi:hypothetical protein
VYEIFVDNIQSFYWCVGGRAKESFGDGPNDLPETASVEDKNSPARLRSTGVER